MKIHTKTKKLSAAVLILAAMALLVQAPPASAQEPALPSTDNLLINPGFELPDILPEAGGWGNPSYGWHNFHGGYEWSGAARSGQHGIKVVNDDLVSLAGAYQRISLNQTELKPVFIGGFVRGENIVNSPNGYFGAGLYAEIHMDDGSVAYWNSIANYGTFSWRWIGFNTGTLSYVNRPISHIFVVPMLGRTQGTAYFDDLSAHEFSPARPAVTIMIDDGELSTIAEAKPVMDSYGYAGSAAIITNVVGEEPYMNWGQIKALRDNGWEITSHGLNHADLTALSEEEMVNELAASKKIFEEQGINTEHIILPYGAYNGSIIAEAAKYYSSARAYEQGSNPRGVFPFDVKIRGVHSSTMPQDVEAWINQAGENGRWLILVFHTIAETGGDAYHTTPSAFRQIIEEIAGSGLDVVTYGEGLDMFGVPKPAINESPAAPGPEPPVEAEPADKDQAPETAAGNITQAGINISEKIAGLKQKLESIKAEFGQKLAKRPLVFASDGNYQ